MKIQDEDAETDWHGTLYYWQASDKQASAGRFSFLGGVPLSALPTCSSFFCHHFGVSPNGPLLQ